MYNVGIYIRLSKEDVDRGLNESESIKNQKDLLIEYVKGLGQCYSIIQIYEDQGYTGTNFDRPGFQLMIKDILLSKINMVITKDLSRLGRDYIETGKYIEKWFPEHNVRYVSVVDGIDTFNSSNANNDIAPFKSILNDMYSKDLSKKIRTALHTMQKQGKWVGGRVAFGYMKDKNDKNRLIVCDKEAVIVKKIFSMAYFGKSVSEIRDYLNENNILTASGMRYNKMTFWDNKNIKNILKNKIYIGISIQNKRSRISYKNRKIINNLENEWYVVFDTHEPIVEKEVFNRVQKLIGIKKLNKNKKKNTFLLDGLIYCYECKHKIGVRKRKNGDLNMICNNYRKNSKLKICTSHGFSYSNFESSFLKYISKLLNKMDINKLKTNIKKGIIKIDYRKIIKKIDGDILLINDNIDKIYLDKLNGKISNEMYERLNNKLNLDLKNSKEKVLNIKKHCEFYDLDVEVDKMIADLIEIRGITNDFLNILIRKIEIHQDKKVDVIFNFKEYKVS